MAVKLVDLHPFDKIIAPEQAVAFADGASLRHRRGGFSPNRNRGSERERSRKSKSFRQLRQIGSPE
jgi:hypothetical protein